MVKFIRCLIVVVAFGYGCKKESAKCEKWLVQNKCYPKSTAVHCFYYDPRETTVCGDRLKEARPGNEVERENTADARLTMLYIRRID